MLENTNSIDVVQIINNVDILMKIWLYHEKMTIPSQLYFSELPYNDYFEYYGPDFKLNISPSNMANHNNPEFLEKIK